MSEENNQSQQAVEEPPTGTVADVFGEEETTTVETPVVEPQTPKVETPILTPDQIRDSVRDGMRAAAQDGQQQDLTPAQLDQMFNVWNPTEQLIADVLGGGEKALAAMVEMRNGLIKQSDTLTMRRLELLERKLLEQISPALSNASEVAAAKDRDEFFTEHEDLKVHEKLVQTVFDALRAQGYRAKDKAEAYKTLADRTRALLPNNNGNGSANGQPSAGHQQQNRVQTTARPAKLSSGGGAGGGGNSAPVTPFAGGEVFL